MKFNITLSQVHRLASGILPQKGNYRSLSTLEARKSNFEINASPDDWTEFRIPVPWGYIAGKTYGDPSGYPILAVHGIMDNCGTFDRLTPLLSKSLFIVAIDLAGHGLSSHLPPGAPYHYIDMVSSIRRVTNHFGWTKFSWLGHSLGAGLGAVFASIFPTHTNRYKYLQKVDGKLSSLESATFEQPFVDRVVMIDLVFPLTGVSGDNYATKISVAIDQFLHMEEKHDSTKGPPHYEYDDAVERLIKGTGNALTAETAKILMKRGTTINAQQRYSFSRDSRIRSSLMLGFTNEKCMEVLSGIRSPVFFIKAKNSSWYWKPEVYEKVLGIYKKNCPTFQYDTVDGNHFVHLNHPEKIAGAINQFLVGDSTKL